MVHVIRLQTNLLNLWAFILLEKNWVRQVISLYIVFVTTRIEAIVIDNYF